MGEEANGDFAADGDGEAESAKQPVKQCDIEMLIEEFANAEAVGEDILLEVRRFEQKLDDAQRGWWHQALAARGCSSAGELLRTTPINAANHDQPVQEMGKKRRKRLERRSDVCCSITPD